MVWETKELYFFLLASSLMSSSLYHCTAHEMAGAPISDLAVQWQGSTLTVLQNSSFALVAHDLRLEPSLRG